MHPDQTEAILAAVPMPLMLIGQDDLIVGCNAAAEAMFGKTTAGRHYVTVLRQPQMVDCVERSLATNVTEQTRLQIRDAVRDALYQAVAAPVRIDGADGVLLSLRDISDVEAADQMRRDFVANVSHELRTPLTALIGFIETLQGPARDDPAARERFLGIMEREARRMNRLIEDLLSLSRVEADERRRPAGRADIAALTRSAIDTLTPLAGTRGVQLTAATGNSAMDVPGEADQILQVLTNLIENAIKYGHDRVSVELSSIPREAALRGPAVRIVVADNGDGIDPLHIPRLTERFYRVDDHRSREMGGTGLGLAIVKHIVGRHRGRLRIESTPGAGSRFVVVLPA